MKRITAVMAVALLLTPAAHAETYRLIHAMGNAEYEVARDLSKDRCEDQKKELKVTAEKLGSYSERLGIGSITCLPESIFED